MFYSTGPWLKITRPKNNELDNFGITEMDPLGTPKFLNKNEFSCARLPTGFEDEKIL
jgi:hypothetical protein